MVWLCFEIEIEVEHGPRAGWARVVSGVGKFRQGANASPSLARAK
jgi:hypothetical protein